MSARGSAGANAPATSPEVRGRLADALHLDLVGPGAGHAFAAEQLPGWVRPSTWYLAGFLIPSGTPSDKSADADEDDDFELVGESAGLAEESNEDRRAAQKGHFPSSMGLSFLAAQETRSLTVTVRWGDYMPARAEGEDGKPLSIWQRTAHEESVPVELKGVQEDERRLVPGSHGLELHVVERPIAAESLSDRIPQSTRSPPTGTSRSRTCTIGGSTRGARSTSRPRAEWAVTTGARRYPLQYPQAP